MIRLTATALLVAAAAVNAYDKYYDHCFAVTLFDTFGDGWGTDVALQVKTLHKTELLYLTCPYGQNDITKFFCTCDPFVEFSVVDLVDHPKETWEVLWKVDPYPGYSRRLDETSEANEEARKLPGVNPFEMLPSYFGDYHTVLQGTLNPFELHAKDPVYVWSPYDTSAQYPYYWDENEDEEEYAECKPCPKPKPKPKPKPEGEDEDVVYEYSGSYSYSYSCPFYSSLDYSYSSSEGGSEGGAAKPKPKPKPLRKLQIQLHYSQEYSHSSYSSYEFSSYSSYEFSSYEWSNSFFCRYSSYEFSSYDFSYYDFCSDDSPNDYLNFAPMGGYYGYGMPPLFVNLDGSDSYPINPVSYEDRWFQSRMELIPSPLYIDSGVYSYGAFPSPVAFFQYFQQVPATLTTPHYTIATADRVHLIKEGTMCKLDGTEICEEYIPDGEYVFRVTGALRFWQILSDDEKKWSFCGTHGTWMEELEFTIENGQCYPGRQVEAFSACYDELACPLSGTMVLRGTKEELNAYDTALLENDLSAMLSESSGLPSKAMIESWEATSSGLYITYKLVISPEVHGEEALSGTFLSDIASGFDSKASSFASSGKFVSLLSAGLDDLPLNTDITVNKASGVSFSHVVPGECKLGAAPKVHLSASTVSQKASAVFEIKSLSSLQSTVTMLAAAAGFVAVVAVVVYRIRSHASAEEEDLEDESVARYQRRPFASDVSRRGANVETVQETVPQF
jgi:hypothetical protein